MILIHESIIKVKDLDPRLLYQNMNISSNSIIKVKNLDPRLLYQISYQVWIKLYNQLWNQSPNIVFNKLWH